MLAAGGPKLTTLSNRGPPLGGRELVGLDVVLFILIGWSVGYGRAQMRRAAAAEAATA